MQPVLNEENSSVIIPVPDMTLMTGSCIITQRAAVKADTFIPSGCTSTESNNYFPFKFLPCV